MITGASGLIGSAVYNVLKIAEFPIIRLVRQKMSANEFELDPSRGLVGEIQQKADVIVHFAAKVPNPPAVRDDVQLAEQTAQIDRAIVEAAEAWNAQLIYASGCSLYDRRDTSLKVETSRLAAQSPYLRAKMDGEKLARGLQKSCIMRISAPVGSGIKKMSVLSSFVDQAKANGAIEVWGSGTREQDFVSVRDIAEFVLLAIQRRATGTYNVASAQPTTMKLLAETVIMVMGEGRVLIGARSDPRDMETARFSNEAARLSLGWSPQLSLNEMVAQIMGGSHAG